MQYPNSNNNNNRQNTYSNNNAQQQQYIILQQHCNNTGNRTTKATTEHRAIEPFINSMYSRVHLCTEISEFFILCRTSSCDRKKNPDSLSQLFQGFTIKKAPSNSVFRSACFNIHWFIPRAKVLDNWGAFLQCNQKF